MALSPAWRLEATVGARLITGTNALLEPQLGVGGAWWPRGLAGRAGFGLSVRGGSGVSVGRDRFVGRFNDTAVTTSVRTRFGLLGALSIEIACGGSLHVTSLTGQLAGATLRKSRVDPSIDVTTTLDWSLSSHVSVGMFNAASYNTRYQRYVVGDSTIYAVPSFGDEVGLRICIGFW